MGAATKIETEERIEVLFTQYDQPHIAGSLCSRLNSYGKGAHAGWKITRDPIGIAAQKDGEEIIVPWGRIKTFRRYLAE